VTRRAASCSSFWSSGNVRDTVLRLQGVLCKCMHLSCKACSAGPQLRHMVSNSLWTDAWSQNHTTWVHLNETKTIATLPLCVISAGEADDLQSIIKLSNGISDESSAEYTAAKRQELEASMKSSHADVSGVCQGLRRVQRPCGSASNCWTCQRVESCLCTFRTTVPQGTTGSGRKCPKGNVRSQHHTKQQRPKDSLTFPPTYSPTFPPTFLPSLHRHRPRRCCVSWRRCLPRLPPLPRTMQPRAATCTNGQSSW
jgi:hypothetical protein